MQRGCARVKDLTKLNTDLLWPVASCLKIGVKNLQIRWGYMKTVMKIEDAKYYAKILEGMVLDSLCLLLRRPKVYIQQIACLVSIY